MSIRIEQNDLIRVGKGDTNMMEVTVYATTAEEAAALDTSLYVMGSVLMIVRTGEVYVLDEDGGAWRSVTDGSALA